MVENGNADLTNGETTNNEKFTNSNIIKITGQSERCAEASKALIEPVPITAKDATKSELDVQVIFADHAYAKVEDSTKNKGGSTINKLKFDSDVTINIPDSDSGVTLIRIEGNKAGVEKAKKELMEITEKMENENEKDSEMQESSSQVIGKGGANLQRIRDETDTRVDLPDSDMITGNKANVNKAVDEIQKIQSEMANIVSKELKIPALIQSIVNECGEVRLLIIINTSSI